MRPERYEDEEKKEAERSIGQSEVVGLVLVFGITFVSIGVILATGMPSLNQAEELAEVERAQVDFLSLDQEIRESVHTPGQSGVSVNLAEGGISVDNGSLMTVNVTHSPSAGGSDTANMRLGGLLYETGDSGVAYQMGGVWATYSDGGFSMNTPPDIIYEDTSLKIEGTNFTENVRVDGTGRQEFTVRSEGTERIDEPAGSLENGTLSISVGTGYDDPWTEYFNRTFGVDNVDSDDGFANVTLRTGPPLFGVEYLGDRYDGDTFLPILGDDTELPVYDSRIGDESDYNHTVDTDSFDEIDPLPVTGDDIDACIQDTGGDQLPGGDTVESGVYSENSNINIGSNYSTFDTSSGVISVYAENNVIVDSVEFDTSGGEIEFYVDGNLNINDGDISVNGSNPVRFYADSIPSDIDADSIQLQDEQTELFQVYTYDDGGDITVDMDYNGTIYAPENSIEIGNDNEFRGAAIAEDEVEVEVNGEYYHDTALRQADLPDCIDPPVSSFEAVDRKVSMR